MSLQIGITHPSQQKYKDYINKVLNKLPIKDRVKICEEYFVCLVGYNYTDQFGHTDKDVIVLNTQLIDELWFEAQKMRIIAHEFAHHILKHPPPMKSGMKEQHEKEVETLLEEWGFSLVK